MNAWLDTVRNFRIGAVFLSFRRDIRIFVRQSRRFSLLWICEQYIFLSPTWFFLQLDRTACFICRLPGMWQDTRNLIYDIRLWYWMILLY